MKSYLFTFLIYFFVETLYFVFQKNAGGILFIYFQQATDAAGNVSCWLKRSYAAVRGREQLTFTSSC